MWLTNDEKRLLYLFLAIILLFAILEVVFNRNYADVNVDSFAPPTYPKSEHDRIQLNYNLEKSFLTQGLSSAALATIIDSMKLKFYPAGARIIT